LGHPQQISTVSRLGFVTALMSLNGGQPNYARLAWYTMYYILGGSCSLTESCQVQTSFCAQILRSPILAALLHSTPALGVSQTLWRSADGATYIRQAAITLGIDPHSSYRQHCAKRKPAGI